MVNHLVYQGRLVADPELNDTNSGTKVCNITVAWNEKYKERENSCFLDCKAFSSQAEHIGRYFRKGQEIIVEGKLNREEWESNGQKRSKIVLVVSSVHFCGKRQDGEQAVAAPSPAPVSVADGELPF